MMPDSAKVEPGKTPEELQKSITTEIEQAAELDGLLPKLAHAVEKIIPLVAKLFPESVRLGTLDMVANGLGLKTPPLKAALKEEFARLTSEAIAEMVQEEQAERERLREEYLKRIEEAQPEIDTLFSLPRVLERLQEDAALMHNVKGDKDPLSLALLVALGAQLAPLPNGRPLGASMLFTADAGRGKNHIVDAAVTPLPEEFYLAFEIASGQSLYYAAAENPDFLKHRFVYPNEIEGVDALVEFLRPMLSKGWATKYVTNKDSEGRNVMQELIVEGPVTTAIPTIRNKTDDQLHTRLLVAELEDYPGRVKAHSKAVSELLHPDYSAMDHSQKLFLWREGLRQLTGVRRVVFPLDHPDFALDDDQIGHGARLWANLLGLMSAHAWLEQKNRQVIELPSGEAAIVATPEDYEVAYTIFNRVAQRTVINLSDTHRKILNALYDLEVEFPNREGFTQRQVSKTSGVALGTVSNNKTFLVMSAKLIRVTDHGLILVEGAEPSWWAGGEKIMSGLPSPAMVRSWWGEHEPPPGGAEHAEQSEQHTEPTSEPHTYAANTVQGGGEHPLNTVTQLTMPAERVQHVFSEGMNSENGLPKPNTSDRRERVQRVHSVQGAGGERALSENGGKCIHDVVGGCWMCRGLTLEDAIAERGGEA